MKELIAHEKAKEYFRKQLKEGRLNHAYAFVGKKGIGKMLFAKLLAKEILDIKFEDTENIQNPDLLIISTEERYLKIDDVKRISEFLNFKPFKAKKKLVIIDEAEKLNETSQNKLLKTLENPPNFAQFILIINKTAGLIEPLKSRLFNYNFASLSHREMIEFIKLNSLELNEAIIDISRGSPEFYRENIVEKESTIILIKSLLSSILQKDQLSFYKAKTEILKDVDSSEFLSFFELILISALKSKSITDYISAFLNLDSQNFRTNEKLNDEKILRILEHIKKAEYKLRRNQNKDIVLSNLFYKTNNLYLI